jgi:hypothetical protein
MIALVLAIAIAPDFAMDRPGGGKFGWAETQARARANCARCTRAIDWGNEEESRAWMARATRDANFRPLEAFVFFAVRGIGAADVVVTLRDGRRFSSFVPEIGPTRASANCAKLRGMLSGQDSTRLVVVRGSFKPREVAVIEAIGLGTWRSP